MIKPADKFSILKLRYKHGMSILESSELMVINLPLKKAKELINTLPIGPYIRYKIKPTTRKHIKEVQDFNKPDPFEEFYDNEMKIL